MSKSRVIVVEDDSLVRETLIDCLSEDFEVTSAKNGIEGLSMIRETQPDLVLTDYNMPGMNGFELVRRLRESHYEIPVICLTGRGSSEIHQDLWIRGIYEYMEKPFEPLQLIKKIHAAIALRGGLHTEDQFRNLRKRFEVDLRLEISERAYLEADLMARKAGVSFSTLFEKLVESELKKVS